MGQLTWVFLPLQAVDRPLGTLELGYSGQFGSVPGQEGRANLAAFGNQVAIAVHNMQLLRRTDEALARRIVELERLRSSSLTISSTLDVPTVLARIIRDLRALFPETEATIWEYDAPSGQLCVLQSSLADEEYLSTCLGPASATRRAVATGKVQIVADLNDLVEEAGHGPAARLGLHGLIAVPLVSHDRILGAINLYFCEAGAAATQTSCGRRHAWPGGTPAMPESGTAELLQAFAAHAAVAIENARLHEEEIKQQRLEQELVVAKTIQQSLLPLSNPQVPGWQFAAAYRSARVVGGDFYDFCELPGEPRRIGVVVADVTDKGVPAAIFMALSRTIIRTMAMSGRGPAAALQRANDLILNDSPSNISVTALYAVFEVEAGQVTFANAGHIRPLLCRASRQLRERAAGARHPAGSLRKHHAAGAAGGCGARRYACSSTLTASPMRSTQPASRSATPGWRAWCSRHARAARRRSSRGSWTAVAEFVGDQEQADDITCVVVKRVAETVD